MAFRALQGVFFRLRPSVRLHVILLVFIFLIHQAWQGRSGSLYLFIDNWLDPFLIMPLLAVFWQIERYCLLQNRPAKPLTGMEMGALTVLIAGVGEGLFPLINSACIRDATDLPAYFAGSLYGWVFFRDPWRISVAGRLSPDMVQ